MLTVNRKRFFAAPAVRVKVCICMGSGDVWKWYYLIPERRKFLDKKAESMRNLRAERKKQKE